MFDVGDVIGAHDGASIGTIATVTSNTSIALTDNVAADIEQNDLIYNLNPITLLLTFERGN